MGFLDRLAGGMGDFGYGSNEQQKRAALARALAALGGRMAAGASSEGFGALAPAVSGGFSAYQGGLADLQKQQIEEEERQRQAERAALQDRYTGALIEQSEASVVSKEEAQEQARQKMQERADLIARRRAWLEGQPPEIQNRLAPALGSEDFDNLAFQATAPAKPIGRELRSVDGVLLDVTNPDVEPRVLYRSPEKPDRGGSGGGSREPKVPTTRTFADGSTRQWNPDTGEWDVKAEKPQKTREERATEIYNRTLTEGGPLLVRDQATDEVDLDATWERSFEAAGGKPAPKSVIPASVRGHLDETRRAAEVLSVRHDLSKYGEATTRAAMLRAGKTPAEIAALFAAAKKK